MSIDVDDATLKIVIQCAEDINGIADVYIDYEVLKREGNFSIFNIQRMLNIVNTGIIYAGKGSGSVFESNNLRNKSREYIPVSVVNGYGEVTLTANPKKSTYLFIKNYSCDIIYNITSDYLELAYVQNSEERSTLCIPLTEKNKNSISGNIYGIVYGKKQYAINQIWYDENILYIELIGHAEATIKNIVRLLKVR